MTDATGELHMLAGQAESFNYAGKELTKVAAASLQRMTEAIGAWGNVSKAAAKYQQALKTCTAANYEFLDAVEEMNKFGANVPGDIGDVCGGMSSLLADLRAIAQCREEVSRMLETKILAALKLDLGDWKSNTAATKKKVDKETINAVKMVKKANKNSLKASKKNGADSVLRMAATELLRSEQSYEATERRHAENALKDEFNRFSRLAGVLTDISQRELSAMTPLTAMQTHVEVVKYHASFDGLNHKELRAIYKQLSTNLGLPFEEAEVIKTPPTGPPQAAGAPSAPPATQQHSAPLAGPTASTGHLAQQMAASAGGSVRSTSTRASNRQYAKQRPEPQYEAVANGYDAAPEAPATVPMQSFYQPEQYNPDLYALAQDIGLDPNDPSLQQHQVPEGDPNQYGAEAYATDQQYYDQNGYAYDPNTYDQNAYDENGQPYDNQTPM